MKENISQDRLPQESVTEEFLVQNDNKQENLYYYLEKYKKNWTRHYLTKRVYQDRGHNALRLPPRYLIYKYYYSTCFRKVNRKIKIIYLTICPGAR